MRKAFYCTASINLFTLFRHLEMAFINLLPLYFAIALYFIHIQCLCLFLFCPMSSARESTHGIRILHLYCKCGIIHMFLVYISHHLTLIRHVEMRANMCAKRFSFHWCKNSSRLEPTHSEREIRRKKYIKLILERIIATIYASSGWKAK